MVDHPIVTLLSDTELDVVTGGGKRFGFYIRQNAQGLDGVAFGANGADRDNAISIVTDNASGVGAAIAGVGGVATSRPGGNGGTNTIIGPR